MPFPAQESSPQHAPHSSASPPVDLHGERRAVLVDLHGKRRDNAARKVHEQHCLRTIRGSLERELPQQRSGSSILRSAGHEIRGRRSTAKSELIEANRRLVVSIPKIGPDLMFPSPLSGRRVQSAVRRPPDDNASPDHCSGSPEGSGGWRTKLAVFPTVQRVSFQNSTWRSSARARLRG